MGDLLQEGLDVAVGGVVAAREEDGGQIDAQKRAVAPELGEAGEREGLSLGEAREEGEKPDERQVPVTIMDMAREACSGATRRTAKGEATDQKTACEAATTRRASTSSSKVGATAEAT